MLEDNQAGCIKRTHENHQMASRHEHQLEELDIWRRNELARKLELFMGFYDGFSATQIYFNKTITEIKLLKADTSEVQSFEKGVEERLSEMEQKVQQQRDDQLTLEHYTERYIPVQIQNMIIENMRHLHPDSDMVKLTGE